MFYITQLVSLVKRARILLIGLGFCSTVVCSAMQTFPLANEAQLKQQISKNRNDLRASYDLIIQARNKDLAPNAAQYYSQLLSQEKKRDTPLFDPKLQTEYTFCIFVARDKLEDDSDYDRHSPVPPQLQRWVEQHILEPHELLPQSHANMPDDATVTLMLAREKFAGYIYEERDDVRRQNAGIELAKLATRQDPQWAAAQFWVGRMLIEQNTNYGGSSPKVNEQKNAREALPYLQRAQKLDASYAAGCYQHYFNAYITLKQISKAIQSMDAYGKLRPQWAKLSQNIKVRQQLVMQLKQKQASMRKGA